jgi:hypothetical protein
MNRSATGSSETIVSVSGSKGCCGLRVSATLAAVSRRCSSDRKRVACNQAASRSNQPSLPFWCLLICLIPILRRNSPRRRRGYEATNPTKGYAIPQGTKAKLSQKGNNRGSQNETGRTTRFAEIRVAAHARGLASPRPFDVRALEAPQPHYNFGTSQGYFCVNEDGEILAQAVIVGKNLGIQGALGGTYASGDDQDRYCRSRWPRRGAIRISV